MTMSCDVHHKKILTPFIPEFLKWAHPSLNLDTSIAANSSLVKNQS